MMLRKFTVLLLVSGALIGAAIPAAAETEVRIASLPATLAAFKAMQAEGSTPEKAAALFIVAMRVWNTDPKLSEAMMAEASVERLRGKKSGKLGTGLQYHLGRTKDRLGIMAGAYAQGTKLETGYTPPEGAGYRFLFDRNKYSGSEEKGQVKVFVTLAEGVGLRPRPIASRRGEDGIWRVYEVSSMFLDVPIKK